MRATVARGSLWIRLRTAEARLPQMDANGEVIGILRRIIDVGALDKIGGLSYTACVGNAHPLDGQEISFDPPIETAHVPTPWRELLQGQSKPLVPASTAIPAAAAKD